MSVLDKDIARTYILQDWTIHVLSPVFSIWMEYRQLKPYQREGCGVLIGSFERNTNTYWIEACTKPFDRDRRSRNSFRMQDVRHQNKVDDLHLKSGGKLFYFGTWHTHPESSPKPSLTDTKDWEACIKRNAHIPAFLFAIIGVDDVFLYPRNDKLG